MKPETRAFFDSLAPRSFRWLGRSAFLRGYRGVFELHEDSSGYGTSVTALRGIFTADSGSQSHITFRFRDFLVSTNPTKNPNWTPENLSGWWKDSAECRWHIGVPESLKPLHDAIEEWVEIFDGGADQRERPLAGKRRRS